MSWILYFHKANKKVCNLGTHYAILIAKAIFSHFNSKGIISCFGNKILVTTDPESF